VYLYILSGSHGRQQARYERCIRARARQRLPGDTAYLKPHFVGIGHPLQPVVETRDPIGLGDRLRINDNHCIFAFSLVRRQAILGLASDFGEPAQPNGLELPPTFLLRFPSLVA
jgi:hypothetical protein